MKKIILLLLVFPSLAFSKSKITIQQTCKDFTTPLVQSEGLFTQEQELNLPDKIITKNDLINFVKLQIKDPKESSELLTELELIFNLIQSQSRTITRKVNIHDLLINQTSTCTYESIFERENNIISISSSFDHLRLQDQFIHILEVIHFPFPVNYSDVGLRNYIYNLLDEKFNLQSDKFKVGLKINAGYDFFYKGRTKINIQKIKHYNDDDSIRIASLIEDSIVHTPGGDCIASTIRPVLFEKEFLKVFTVKNRCKLEIGNKFYETRQDSVVQLRNHGVFINHPLPAFIESIYVPTDAIIENNYVRLKASSDPTKKSKIHFHLDGSGKIEGYVQFLGDVFLGNKFYKMRDYHNLWRHNHEGSFNQVVIDDNIKVRIDGVTNQYTGIIYIDDKNIFRRGTIVGIDPKIKLNNQMISVLPNTEIKYFPSRKVQTLFLGKATRLKTVENLFRLFPEGHKIELTVTGLVK